MAEYSPAPDPIPEQKAQPLPTAMESVAVETRINGSSEPLPEDVDAAIRPVANGISPQPARELTPTMIDAVPQTVATEVTTTAVEPPVDPLRVSPPPAIAIPPASPPPNEPPPPVVSDGPSPGPTDVARPRDDDTMDRVETTVETVVEPELPIQDVTLPEQNVSNLRDSPKRLSPIPAVVDAGPAVVSSEEPERVVETIKEVETSHQQATPPPEIAEPSEPAPTVTLKLSTTQTPADDSVLTIQKLEEEIAPSDEPTETVEALKEAVDQEMRDVPQTTLKITHERDEDDEGEPAAKRTKTDEPEMMEVETVETKDFKVPEAPFETSASAPIESASTSQAIETPATSQAFETPTTSQVIDTAIATATPGEELPTTATAPTFDFGPMTDAQNKRLIEGMRNIRKGKHALNYQKPVDPEALNLPTYLTIVKQPMDLSTMEQKLKNKGYQTVEQYVADFDLMVQNSVTFNGPEHPVSQAGMMLKSQLNSQLKKLPKAGEPVPEPPPKKQRTEAASLPSREPKPRDSRLSTGALPSPSTPGAPMTTYAPGPDGVPHIRRDSSTADGRPKREIHKPPPRDLPYTNAKPKKKKFQMELKFCQNVLDELSRPKYNAITYPFKEPVDPVALNIPDYHKIIKKPMDMKTIGNKLNSGQYENAKEFETDIRLMLQNCFKFNPPNNAIFQVGKTLEGEFETLWSNKQNWIAQNDPSFDQQSPEPETESEEEEEEEPDDTATRLAEIQKQISELTQQASSLLSQGQSQSSGKKRTSKSGTSKKSSKPSKPGASKQSRKSGSFSAGAGGASRQDKKQKTKPKTKKITMAEKQEISNRIGELSPEQISRAAELIKASLRKIGRSDLADRADDDLEFDIEMIPDDTLHNLLKLVRGNLGSQGGGDESRAETSTVKDHSSKPKKNKPMSKHEQDDRIRQLEGQLSAFKNPTSGDSMSPDQGKEGAESSGDEPESGSESEEE